MQSLSSNWAFSRLAERPYLVVAALVALCVALYWPSAARTPFFTKGESREALVVKRMVTDGDWILPQRPSAYGWTIASKPPLFHWLGAATASAAGAISEISVRFPSLLLGGATVALVGLAAAPILGARSAMLAAVILATTFEWTNAAQTARVDGTLAAFMTFALLIFYRAFVAGELSSRAALVAYFCLAAAALTKGPVGFVLPGLVLGSALVLTRQWHMLRALRPGLGALVIVTIVGGWYLAAWGIGGDPFFEKHVLKENVFRFLGGGDRSSGHDHAPPYYIMALAVGFLPWSPVLVGALIAALRKGTERRDPRLGFLLAWFGTVFVFYSVASSKRSVYLLALYPAAALLSGWWIETLPGASAPSWLRARTSRTIQRCICAIVAIPLLVVVLERLGAEPLNLLIPLLKPKDQANLPLVRGVILGNAPLVLLSSGAVLAAVILGFRTLRNAQWLRAFASVAVLASTLWILVFAVFRPEIAHRRSLATFMAWAVAETRSADLYFYPPSFDFGAAFYAPDGVRYLADVALPGGQSRWVLIWDRDFAALTPEERARLEVLKTSEGTDPKGKRHMMLAKLRPSDQEPSG